MIISNTYVSSIVNTICVVIGFLFLFLLPKLYIDMNKLLKNGNPFLNENSQ